MKKFTAAAALIALAAGLFFTFKSNPPAPDKPPDRNTAAAVYASHLSAPAPPKSSDPVPAVSPGAAPTSVTSGPGTPTVSAKPAAVAISSLPPLTVLDNARVAVKNYGARYGENPVGTNPEITAALAGNNPQQIHFITADSGLRVNERGEMVDAWGTPLFFHQLSGREMEIRSAGEDRKMWTYDDLVTR